MSRPLAPVEREPAVDWRSVGLGAILVATLATGFAAGATALVRHTLDPDTGPTAAALSEGFAAFYAAGIGIAVGGAIAAALSRRGRWVADGVLAAVVGYCLVIGVAAATGPSDLTFEEYLEFAFFFAAPAIGLGTVGAIIAAGVRRARTRAR